MKPTFPLFQHRSRTLRRGIALISVLAMVVLLTALVVAFMLRAGSERQSSGFYKAETGSRSLADTAINLVQAQINEATSQGLTVAWASQPGAIRTFNNGSTGSTGNTTTGLINIYRLYSNPVMRTGTVGDLANDIPNVNWLNEPAVWVDLNAPVNNDPAQAPVNTHFPILDPRDPSNLAHDLSDGIGGTTLDGFFITTAAPIYSYANNIDTNLNKNPAPMPVQWLYVLQDGSVIPPDSGSTGTSVLFTKAPSGHLPSATNPIVGRIAFWTDDETCKVNINTAGGDGKMASIVSGGVTKADPTDIANKSFWSTPYYNNADENGINGGGVISAGFGTSIPVSTEYQRYPGHPATVALNEVLSSLLYGSSGTAVIPSSQFFGLSNGNGSYTGLTPRYAFGGSQGGTVVTDAGGVSITQVSSRLYPTVSELLFNPDGTSSTSRTATVLNTTATDSTTGINGTTRQRAETARFFLTTHSRAPELNLFGLPRICMWPVSSTTSSRTPVDQLLAFCSTIGTNTYYFTRKSALDGTADIGITRNQSILSYLDILTQQLIPGFGGSFSTKSYYAPGSTKLEGTSQTRQILTEIFDYIRMTNIDDAAYNSNGNEGAAAYGGSTWPGYGGGTNQIAPTQYSTWGTQGVGAYPRLNEVAFNFIPMGQGGSANTATPGNPSNAINALAISPSEMSFYTASNAHGYGTNGTYLYSGNTITDLTQGDAPSSSTLTYNYTGTGAPWTQPGVGPGAGQYVPPGTTGKSAPPATAPAIVGYNQIYSVYNNQTGVNSGIPPDGTTVIQVLIYLGFINPAQEWITSLPSVYLTVDGLQNLALRSGTNGTIYPLHFPSAIPFVMRAGANGWAGGYNPGYINFTGMFNGGLTRANPGNGLWFPFFSSLIPLTTAPTMTLCNSIGSSPTAITITESDGKGSSYSSGNVVQTYTINVPTAAGVNGALTPSSSPGIANATGGTLPMPYLYSVAASPPGTRINAPGVLSVGYTSSLVPPGAATTEITGPVVGTGGGGMGGNVDPTSAPEGKFFQQNNNVSFDRWAMAPVSSGGATYLGQSDVIQSMVPSQAWSDPRVLAVKTVPSSAFVTHPGWAWSLTNQFADTLGVQNYASLPGNSNRTNWGATPLVFSNLNPCLGTLSGLKPDTGAPVNLFTNLAVAPAAFTSPGGNPVIPKTQSGAPPDWDNGISLTSDGPWINKSDEGCAIGLKGDGTSYNSYFQLTFASNSGTFSANREIPSPGMFGSLPTGVDPAGLNPAGWQTLLFRPGSGSADYLNGITTSTRIHTGEGTPANLSSTGYAPLYTVPPDHLWMDLFWMPEAEPYAISEPFSTGGKINLNYQIVPFTYIKRATALRAAMAGEEIGQVSLLNGLQGYKSGGSFKSRRPIDLDATLSQFEAKFNGTSGAGAPADIFHSASQICEEYLVPLEIAAAPYSDTHTYSSNSTWTDTTGVAAFAKDWYTVPPTTYTVKSSNTLMPSGNIPDAPFAMVGDNVRERPYTDLYAKVTTKSNTYTVYYRVQTLKSPPSLPSSWDETKGSVTGEYRGSTTLERFIDPTKLNAGGTASDYSDYATATLPAANLEGYYQWRVVENRQFTP